MRFIIQFSHFGKCANDGQNPMNSGEEAISIQPARLFALKADYIVGMASVRMQGLNTTHAHNTVPFSPKSKLAEC